MEETQDADTYTLTSFEPLSPEQEKPKFFRFVETLKRSKELVTGSTNVAAKGADGAGIFTKYSKEKSDVPQQRGKPAIKGTVNSKGLSINGRHRKRSPIQSGASPPSHPNPHLRTPSKVLKRLSFLLSADKVHQEPKHSSGNFKQYWMPDEQCKVCYECGVKFNTFRRRHHCRLCGQIFCSQCCNQELGGHQVGSAGLLRVCVYCKKVVIAYTSGADIDNNMKQLKEDLNLVSQADCSAKLTSPRVRAVSMRETPTKLPFDALGVSPEEANILKQDSYKELWQEIMAPKTGLELQTHRVRLRAYSNCLVARELVSWLLVYKKALQRSEALQICQGLLDFGWIESLVTPKQTVFRDEFVLYVPGPTATGESTFPGFRTFAEVISGKQTATPDSSLLSESASQREEIHRSFSTPRIKDAESHIIKIQNRSSSCEELFSKVNRADKTLAGGSDKTYSPVLDHFVRVEDCYVPKRLAQGSESPLQEQQQSVGEVVEKEELKNTASKKVTAKDLNTSVESKDNEEKEALEKLCSIHRRHISSFLTQLLDRVGLSQTWKEIIEPLALRVGDMVVPDVAVNDDMDIRQYVKVKKIPGGQKSDCRIVKGVVCTKNVVHKRMAKSLTHPTILMLSCPVTFQRVENKMASLDPILLQEEEFLKNYVARICDLKPSLLLVAKTVSRLAQEMLLKRGISVILNVKPSLMSRIARCTEGDVLLSLDQGSRPRLGNCQSFKIQKFVFEDDTTKTLAFFEGCSPRFGSTIVLRGAGRRELSKVRTVLEFIIFVAYNSKLEKAFIMDEFGTPFEKDETRSEADSDHDSNNDGKQASYDRPLELTAGTEEKSAAKTNMSPSFNNEVETATLAQDNTTSSKRNSELDSSGNNRLAHDSTQISKKISETELGHALEWDGGVIEKPQDTTQIKSPLRTYDGNGVTNSETTMNMKSDGDLIDDVTHRKLLGGTMLSTHDGHGVTNHEATMNTKSDGGTVDVCNVDNNQSVGVILESEFIRTENTYERTSDRRSPRSLKVSSDCSSSIEQATVIVNDEKFEEILNEVILCSSPLIVYPVPYILTSEGQRSSMVTRDTNDLYWSPMFSGNGPSTTITTDEDEWSDGHKECKNPSVIIKDTHPFVSAWLNRGDNTTPNLLASFRAEGGTIAHKDGPRGLSRMYSDCASWDFVHDLKNTEKQEEGAFYPERDNDRFVEDSFNTSTTTTRKDCFDPFLHQSIAILFSSYSIESANFPRPCISPWTLFMEYYAKNDIALGCFLEKYCFRSSYHCPNPNCDVPMVKHVRYFAHGEGAVYINMKNLETPIPGFSKTLLTWSWCKRCKQVTPVVPVSPEAWRLSFAKYLELRMYGVCYRRRHTLAPCAHSLHQDHYQYFAFNNIVASFKYVSATIFAVSPPPEIVSIIRPKRETEFWIKHIQAMTVRIHHLVNALNYRIASLKTEPFISRCVAESGQDKGQLYGKIEVLENKAMLLLHPSNEVGDNLLKPHEVTTLEYEILDGLTLLKRKLCEFVEKWNTQLLELFQQEYEKKKSKSTDHATIKASSSATSANNVASNDNSCPLSDDSTILTRTTSTTHDDTGSSTGSEKLLTSNTEENGAEQLEEILTDCTNPPLLSASDNNEHTSSAEVEANEETTTTNANEYIRRQSKLWATYSKEVKSTLKRDAPIQEDRPAPKMKKFISNFLPGVVFQPLSLPFPIHEHHLLPKSEMIPIVVNEKEITSIVAYALSTLEYQTKLHTIQDMMTEMENDKGSFTCIDIADGSVISKSSRSRTLVDGPGYTSLLTTLDDYVDDYFKISDSEDEDSVMKAQSSAEPSKSKKKERNIVGNGGEGNKITTQKTIKKEEPLSHEDKEHQHTSSTTQSSSEDVEYHIRHSFSDSQARFFCVAYFAEQFRRIRKAVFPGGEENYIRSLQYCLHWKATGGKSGSSFCKTKDDRFVIKEMSRAEAQSFLNIAPYYFEFIEKAVHDKRQTLLAKILGVYRIGCTSRLNTAPVRKDILVMDNLFYNCKVDKVFDLKGSVRSRYVMSENDDSVLMDENLLEFTALSPLFIRPHTKARLMRAIKEDTEFLAKHMVMDYSLLLGIDTETSRLYVGIIDFIRTFTWDKKLEMYVKSTGILGGQGKMPTVVSPRLYRERFCEAMQRYFLMIPSKWMALGNELKI